MAGLAVLRFDPPWENGGLWRDLPAFTGYLRRCQSVLQSGEPTADALIYFPMEDIRSRDEGMLPLLTIHDQAKWLWPTPFYRAAMELWNTGHPFDFVSDHLWRRRRLWMAECRWVTCVIRCSVCLA